MPDTPDMENWQNLVLEMTLKTNPQLAESIFQTGKWTRFNREKIAALCEQRGLPLRALENYQDIKNIKRVLLGQIQLVPPEYMKSFVTSRLSNENIVPVLSDILKYSRNIKLVVEIAQDVSKRIGLKDLIEMFEQNSSYEGIYHLLIQNYESCKDKTVYHKYIEACAKLGQGQELEKVIKNGFEVYDPQIVLGILLSAQLQDPKSLIILCDKAGFIREMVQYLWENRLTTYLEIYVLKVNQKNSGKVMGSLMDLGADESYLIQLLQTIGSNCDIAQMIQEFEIRSKERLLEGWLEQRRNEGSQLTCVHNALAKIAIDYDKNPQQFLQENIYYDPKVIGAYAESRDAHFAFLAYNRNFGTCDQEILKLTQNNGLFRLQAQYLVQRQNKDLWRQVLVMENPCRQDLVEQVISIVLPESKNVEEVSVTVHAFLEANLNQELLHLLEKILFHSPEFQTYKKLQNLLIYTAMKTERQRVIEYVNRLNNFDVDEMALAMLKPEYGLFEEAFQVYKKYNKNLPAIRVLIDNIQSLERAREFAERVNQEELWTELALGYMRQGNFAQTVNSFILANNPTYYVDVIEMSKKDDNLEKLVEYLCMARKIKKESIIDNELAFCYAYQQDHQSLQQLIQGPNNCEMPKVADRFFQEGLFESALVIFDQLKNNSKICSCFLYLSQFQQALEYAKKANSTKTWKECLNFFLEADEIQMAIQAAQSLMGSPDHLEEAVELFEIFGRQSELINLLEQILHQEKTHINVYTQLAVLYVKYQQEKLFEYIKLNFQKLNVTKVLRICQKYNLWAEVVFLHSNYKEHDNAVKIMMEHSPSCFNHEVFLQNLMKVNNQDLYYQALSFYLEEEPLRLNDFLKLMTPKIDFSKTCKIIKAANCLPLVIEWLKSIQPANIQSVNDELNTLYLKAKDFESLRKSVTQYDQFDAIKLAESIETSNNPEFRRISAIIFRKNKNYKKSIKLLIDDRFYLDAIETGVESNSRELAKNLLLFFAQNNLKEMFLMTTYQCFELITSDDVLELSYRYNLTQITNPYKVQVEKERNSQLESLRLKLEQMEKKQEENLPTKKPIDLNTINQKLNLMGNQNMLTNGDGFTMNQPQNNFGDFGSFQVKQIKLFFKVKIINGNDLGQDQSDPG